MNKLIPVALAVTLVSGCASQGYNMGSGATPNATPDHQESQHFFLEGIGQEKNIDAAAICGSADKVARVESELTASNILFSMLTFGIYTPRDAKVFCAS